MIKFTDNNTLNKIKIIFMAYIASTMSSVSIPLLLYLMIDIILRPITVISMGELVICIFLFGLSIIKVRRPDSLSNSIRKFLMLEQKTIDEVYYKTDFSITIISFFIMLLNVSSVILGILGNFEAISAVRCVLAGIYAVYFTAYILISLWFYYKYIVADMLADRKYIGSSGRRLSNMVIRIDNKYYYA